MEFRTNMSNIFGEVDKQIHQITATLRYNYPLIDIENLSLDKWLNLFGEYIYVRGNESKATIKG